MKIVRTVLPSDDPVHDRIYFHTPSQVHLPVSRQISALLSRSTLQPAQQCDGSADAGLFPIQAVPYSIQYRKTDQTPICVTDKGNPHIFKIACYQCQYDIHQDDRKWSAFANQRYRKIPYNHGEQIPWGSTLGKEINLHEIFKSTDCIYNLNGYDEQNICFNQIQDLFKIILSVFIYLFAK